MFCNEWVPPSNLPGVTRSGGKEIAVGILYLLAVYNSFAFFCVCDMVFRGQKYLV